MKGKNLTIQEKRKRSRKDIGYRWSNFAVSIISYLLRISHLFILFQ